MEEALGSQKRKRQLRRGHKDNSHCSFCGVVTHIWAHRDGETVPARKACLLHLYTKDMPESRRENGHGEKRSEMVCQKCADAYGNGIHAMQPIEKLHEYSGRYPSPVAESAA